MGVLNGNWSLEGEKHFYGFPASKPIDGGFGGNPQRLRKRRRRGMAERFPAADQTARTAHYHVIIIVIVR